MMHAATGIDNILIEVHHPQVDPDEVERKYRFRTVYALKPGAFDAIVLAERTRIAWRWMWQLPRALQEPTRR